MKTSCRVLRASRGAARPGREPRPPSHRWFLWSRCCWLEPDFGSPPCCLTGSAAVADIVALAMVSPAATIARQLKPSVVLKAECTWVAGVGDVGGLHSSGRYVAVATDVGQSPGLTVVINDQTGSKVQLASGCDATALGAVTLAVECENRATEGQGSLTDLMTGQSRPLTINPTLLSDCEPPTNSLECPTVSAIGSEWLVVRDPLAAPMRTTSPAIRTV
jgi:hypothetical protein